VDLGLSDDELALDDVEPVATTAEAPADVDFGELVTGDVPAVDRAAPVEATSLETGGITGARDAAEAPSQVGATLAEAAPDQAAVEEPDAAELDAAEPDAAELDAAEPDAAELDAAEPDAADLDAAEPDAEEPDTIGAPAANQQHVVNAPTGAPRVRSPADSDITTRSPERAARMATPLATTRVPSIPDANLSVASAIEAVARRLRAGELLISSMQAPASDEAALTLALSAILGVRH
jgi:hypothetical protein